MNFPVITKSNFILLTLCLITKLSTILTFTFCDENSIHSSCNCSAIINLDQMDKMCRCFLTSKIYNITCPGTNKGLTIEVKQTNFSEQINIRCKGILIYEEFEQLLPTLKLGNVEDMAIESCPIIRCNGISKYEEFQKIHQAVKIGNVEDMPLERCPIEQTNSNISALVKLSLGVTNYEKLLYAINKPLDVNFRRIQFNTLESREYMSLLGYPYLNIFLDNDAVPEYVHVFNIDVDIDKCIIKLAKPEKAQFAPEFILQIDANVASNILLSNREEIYVLGTTVADPITLVNKQDSPSRLPSKLLSNMPKLQTVHISSFLSLPGDLLINSTNIQGIIMDCCNIKKFPSNIFDSQHNLRILYLEYNKFKYLPQDLLKNAQKLEELYLSYNWFESFSSILVQPCSNLRVLALADAHLIAQNIEFEKSFANHTALRQINLSSNKITHIPENWHIPCHLETLDLRNNQIFVLSAADLKHLISDNLFLDLTYNKILTVNFKDLEEVRQLSKTNITTNLEHNPIHCDCDLLNFILYLRHDIGEYIRNNIKFRTNYLSCNAPRKLQGKLLQQFEMNCYKDAELSLHPLDLMCPLHPSVCPNKCNCWRRDHDQQVVVNCSNIGITSVPKLPILGLDDLTAIKPHFKYNQDDLTALMPHLKYHQVYNVPSLFQPINAKPSESPELTGIELHLENNLLGKLPLSSTPGYANVTKLYLAGNNITHLEKSQMPINLTYLDVRRNYIKSISNITLKFFNESKLMQQMFLSQNPWLCECKNESLDFLRFVMKNYLLVNDSQNMFCNNTQKYFFEQQDLCSKNRIIQKFNDFNIILGIVCTIGLLLGSLVALYYKYQRELKIWLYAHNWCLWFVTEEELDHDKIYDAFISYSSKDEQFVCEHLVPELESGTPSFKLCVYDRDWLVGECIPDAIIRSVKNSKRTIVVLSQNFIESVWAKMEFKAAHQSALNEGRAKVIVIMYGDITENDNLDEDLKAYLKINIYLKWNDPQFWNKLRFAMPHRTTTKYSKLEYISLQRNLENVMSHT